MLNQQSLGKMCRMREVEENFFEESNGIDTFPYFSSKIWGAHVLQRSVIGASRLLPLAIKTDGRSTRKTRKMVGIWPKKNGGSKHQPRIWTAKYLGFHLWMWVFSHVFTMASSFLGLNPGFLPESRLKKIRSILWSAKANLLAMVMAATG